MLAALTILFVAQAQQNSYAGDYFLASRFTSYGLTLRLNRTFDIRFRSDDADEVHVMAGKYQIGKGVIALDPVFSHPYAQDLGLGRKFFPAVWNGRRLMIGETQILVFCNQVQAGWKLSPDLRESGGYLVEKVPDSWQATGIPEVPPLYRQYLTTPFTAQTLNSDSPKRVWINKGSRDGVPLGACFSHGCEVIQLLPDKALCQTSAPLAPNTMLYPTP